MQKRNTEKVFYVLDTNVLIHDPNATLNFEEHHVVIPLTVLEELDKLKVGLNAVAADARQAIRLIDRILGLANPEQVEKGVPIQRDCGEAQGLLSIMMERAPAGENGLPDSMGDNRIINQLVHFQKQLANESADVVLVSKDINMRLKARACGVDAEDYHNDQLISDINLLTKGYLEYEGSFWDHVDKVRTLHEGSDTFHLLSTEAFDEPLYYNQFIIDGQGFCGRVTDISDNQIRMLDLSHHKLLEQEAWGLKPRDIYQAIALHLLMDPEISLVNMTGAAGSGKTILALAAAIEQMVNGKQFRRIIATRSTRGLDEDIGFLPGTEAEKMEPWLGAITDNLEALHHEDENPQSSVEYIQQKVPIQFKSLNYIRGRSFQYSMILIDEAQNLTPHQMKTIITRAGTGSKVVCLGNLAQIDTPYLNPISSGLTYMTERFRDFPYGGCVQLQGIPRSVLAEYAESHL
jgi:PhoH-like ATPase